MMRECWRVWLVRIRIRCELVVEQLAFFPRDCRRRVLTGYFQETANNGSVSQRSIVIFRSMGGILMTTDLEQCLIRLQVGHARVTSGDPQEQQASKPRFGTSVTFCSIRSDKQVCCSGRSSRLSDCRKSIASFVV